MSTKALELRVVVVATPVEGLSITKGGPTGLQTDHEVSLRTREGAIQAAKDWIEERIRELPADNFCSLVVAGDLSVDDEYVATESGQEL